MCCSCQWTIELICCSHGLVDWAVVDLVLEGHPSDLSPRTTSTYTTHVTDARILQVFKYNLLHTLEVIL